ncbi:MAG: bifunctional DNA-formamidopyrimidine glycosylase/DNA-(apurinic or apyrimidinic site) lyase [Streptococcaceae bacterium]|nr:bifunctional DNA-formamidopyrimidine glycosylase/DNA-(apurinic or apyrimidinic site) lyase [Streptococcaceae bacterium]
MPELPEVETIRRGLTKRLIGQKLHHVTVLENKSFQVEDEDKVFLKEASIIGVRRRAKVLMIDLDTMYTLLFHLKMTGQLIFREADSELDDKRNFAAGHPTGSWLVDLPDRSTRVIFDFDNGARLFFNDQRKFGWIKLLPTSEVVKQKFMAELGPEIVDFTKEKIPAKISEKTYKEFIQRVRKHTKAPIKGVILDQKVIAGIGNIYADEGLWEAKIHPATPAQKLSDKDLRRLLRAVKNSMTRSIESGGSTMKNYVKSDGSRGNYLERFANVFRREGQACPRCGTEIIKTKVAGRGTHICPKCQKIEE